MSPESTSGVLARPKGALLPERRLMPRPGLLSLEDFRHFVRKLPKTAKAVSLIGIRQARFEDLPELLGIEEIAWPEGSRVSKEMLASRIEVFPEGVLCATVKEAIVGFACWEIITQTPDRIQEDWTTLTDRGFIKRTHSPNGSTLFGVSLSTVLRAPRDTAFAIGEATKKLAIRKNLPWVALGSRIPRFHRFASKIDVETYIRQFKITGRHIDPELDMYKRMGMTPIRPLSDFFPDPPSCNFGVLLAWKNPFKETADQLNLWEVYRWFNLWEHKIRRGQKSCQI